MTRDMAVISVRLPSCPAVSSASKARLSLAGWWCRPHLGHQFCLQHVAAQQSRDAPDRPDVSLRDWANIGLNFVINLLMALISAAVTFGFRRVRARRGRTT